MIRFPQGMRARVGHAGRHPAYSELSGRQPQQQKSPAIMRQVGARLTLILRYGQNTDNWYKIRPSRFCLASQGGFFVRCIGGGGRDRTVDLGVMNGVPFR